jgi:murein DD-endopeptidase MepM/ murein hydrolase activator NlpD
MSTKGCSFAAISVVKHLLQIEELRKRKKEIGMSFKKLSKSAAAVALTFALLLTPAFTQYSQAATSQATLQNKQSELSKQQKEIQQKISSLKDDAAQQQAYKDALDQQIAVVNEQILVTNEQIAEMDGAISEKEAQIAGQQQIIDEQIAQLKKRLRAIYLAGETTSLDILIGAKDMADLLDKAMLVKTVTQHDQQLIAQLQENMSGIEAEMTAIEEHRLEVAEAKKSLDSKQAELSALQAESQRVLSDLQSQQRDAEQQNAAIQKEKDAISNELAQLQQQAAANGAASSAGFSKGRYIWPVPGFTHMGEGFGARGGRHKGIDINGAGIAGAPIVAVADGVVIKTNVGGWGGGWGTYVMVDHGDGYATQYAHCSRLAVSNGQTVKQGQVIAYVGSTGDSTGNHLHFETWKNGVRYDPMTELR